ncbi:MAG: uracil-DNA glycosylase [Anaerolineae bacterium]|nr:uracil-DNA glycosylase [Anaerolineae bacterium]
MVKWKTPRPLANRFEVDRRKLPNQLYASHVQVLNKFVEEIANSRYANASVPWFDSAGGGVNARLLFLLQDPSDTALSGTGIISPDNPDKTADNTTYYRNKANLNPSEIVHWNVVPWQIGKRNKDEEVIKAIPFLLKLIELLPKLEVVICMGVYATRGWNIAFPNNNCLRGWHKISKPVELSLVAFSCPHPSDQSLKGKHPEIDGLNPEEMVEKTLENVQLLLNWNKIIRGV